MINFTFNHIALSVRDVDESVAFYQKVFHFKEIEIPLLTLKQDG